MHHMEQDVHKNDNPESKAVKKERTTTVIRNKRRRIKQLHFNLLDFIVDKKKQKDVSTRKKLLTSSQSHSAPNSRRIRKSKKTCSRLRRRIILNRKLKSEAKEKLVEDDLVQQIAKLEIGNEPPTAFVHSRRFRSYCDNTTSPKLLDLTEKLLREIFRFQARAYDKNQIKGRAHRRYVCGFKECLRQLSINKVKLMIIATDCEPCSIPGGLDEVLNDIKAKCLETKVPWVFSLERKKLGYILFKRAAVSCVGILSYDGAQGVFHELMECSETEKLRYRETMQLN